MQPKAKLLNVKNMKETLVNYSEEAAELEKIWDAFYQMACLGFISQDAWKRFSDEAAGWYYDAASDSIRDDRRDGAVIWTYTPDAEYKA